MTQEEKAKRYDEVLEKAKSLHQDSQIDFKKSLENLFPELKESDDEKIRKALIFHYQGDGCICTNEYRIDFKDIRAWLEKQGEQKPAEWSEEEKSNIDIIVSRLEVDIEYWESRSKRRVDEDKRIINWLKSLRDSVLSQPKQEWSEEDEKHLKLAIDNFQTLGNSFLTSWLKSLKDRLQVQPKQEWSEEDEKIRQTIINEFEQCYEWCCANGLTKEDCIAWLNRQIHAKWSEEDKKKVNNLYVLLDQMVSFNMLSDKDATEFKDWLKSLKPQNRWKPSDEQINALGSTLQYSQVSHDSFEHLNSLFNDLKKIK